jgi:hypothetical protein
VAACANSASRRDYLDIAQAGDREGAQAQQDPLEQNRSRVYNKWLKAESEHFVLHTPRNGPVARDPDAFLRRRERAYRRIVETLQVEPDGRITIYAYSSSRQGEKLLGRPLAFADPARREIHVRHDQEPGHEETHVIAWAWNQRGCGVLFLEEGLAVALSSHPGSPQAAAADLLARGVLPPLEDLIKRFPSYRNGYALAGSFTGMLIERFGVEMVRELYIGEPREFSVRLEASTGMTLDQLQIWWETVLAAQEPVTREPIVTALSLLQLGDIDAAIILLEQSKSEMPDSPVVEYALAHALRASGDVEGSIAAFRRVQEMSVPYHLAWIQTRAQEALMEMGAEVEE